MASSTRPTLTGSAFYQSSPHRLEVFTNHELSYRYGDPAWSRVSHLTLNGAAKVVAAGYVVDGTERYEYFCSSTMDMIGGVPWYFTGEEWFASPRGGMSIAINALTGQVIETPQFGSLNHENVVPMKDMAKAAMFLSEDSFRLRSQAYSYFADGFSDAIKGRGSFTVWVPDDPGRRRSVRERHRQGRDDERATSSRSRTSSGTPGCS